MNQINNNNMTMVSHSLDPDTLINYFYEIMTEQEKIKLKSLNILKNGVVHHKNKTNSYKKNYSISYPSINLSQSYSLTNSLINNSTNINLNHFNNALSITGNITKDSYNTNYYNYNTKKKLILYQINEIQMEYLPQSSNQFYSPLKYNTQIISNSTHNHKCNTINLNNSNSNIIKAKKIITNPNHKK